MNSESVANDQREPRSPHWVSRAAFSVLVIVFFLSQVALLLVLNFGSVWLALPMALVVSHLMHGILIAFHEASAAFETLGAACT